MTATGGWNGGVFGGMDVGMLGEERVGDGGVGEGGGKGSRGEHILCGSQPLGRC
jgi:hypothetical protein